MTKKFIAGGCSFTLGNELSDDLDGKTPSQKTWASVLNGNTDNEYKCVAFGGLGNPAIARRTFTEMSQTDNIGCVVVMWSFLSRYDWAMPRHHLLEDTRWTHISPWDTDAGNEEAFRTLKGSQTQGIKWRERIETFHQTGVKPFAEAIYKHAANQYHETYLSWKSIIWLQNILEKKGIRYMFTLADNSLFYHEMQHHKDQDKFMHNLWREINFKNWFTFGERDMGFNQWAIMNDYPIGVTHPLDKAHKDAKMLMKPKFLELL